MQQCFYFSPEFEPQDLGLRNGSFLSGTELKDPASAVHPFFG